MKVYKTKISHKDERGEIIDLLEKENVNAITYITFNKGSVRGNHYHKRTVQWCYVIRGVLMVRSQKNNEKVKEIIMKEGSFFVDEPKEAHAFKAFQKTEIMVFTRGPRGGKEYETDTYRLVEPLI